MKGEDNRHDTEAALYTHQIEQYISTYLAQGYTPKQLEEYLAEKGYDAQTVRAALKKINRIHYKGELELHAKKNSLHLILLTAFIILILAMGIFFYSQSTGAYKFLITIENQELQHGEALEFLIGTTKPVEVNIQIQSESGDVFLDKNDVFETSQTYFVQLPKDMGAGDYVVDLFITYKGKEDHKSFSFSIEEQAQQTTSVQTTPTTIIPLEDNSLKEFTQAIQVLDANKCRSISDTELKEECYFVVARDSQNEQVCDSIQTVSKKENCLLTQILAGKDISCNSFETAQGANTCRELS